MTLAFVADLGGTAVMSPVQMLRVQRAVELVLAAEQLRAATLRDERPSDVSLLALTRLEGLADRAIRRLGLEQRRREEAKPDLRTYLASLEPAVEQVAEEATEDEPSGSTCAAPTDGAGAGERGEPG